MKPKFSKIVAVLATLFITSPVFAVEAQATAAKCGDRAKLIKALKDRYKEEPVALGLSQKSTEAFEIYASESGSWTVIMTMSNGVSCVMAAGHSWQNLPKKVAGPVT